MYAIVKDKKVIQTFNNPRKLVINNIRYSTKIYSLWSVDEKKAIGLYEVEFDYTNKKNEDWYINTDFTLTYNSSDDKVTASYGTATARPIADVNEVDDNGDPLLDDKGDQIVTKGLKTLKKEMIDNECASLLLSSDWRVIKAKETGSTMDSGWKTWRASVRTKCNSMQTQIDSASDVDALATLYKRDKDGIRPLGDFPIKE